MEILTAEEISEWLRLDPDTDQLTLDMLIASAIDIVEHRTGMKLRPYLDQDNEIITPAVPMGLKHAIALFVSAHFDDRSGSNEAAMKSIDALCQRYRTVAL